MSSSGQPSATLLVTGNSSAGNLMSHQHEHHLLGASKEAKEAKRLKQKEAERVEKLRMLVSYLKSGSSQHLLSPVEFEADELELAHKYNQQIQMGLLGAHSSGVWPSCRSDQYNNHQLSHYHHDLDGHEHHLHHHHLNASHVEDHHTNNHDLQSATSAQSNNNTKDHHNNEFEAASVDEGATNHKPRCMIISGNHHHHHHHRCLPFGGLGTTVSWVLRHSISDPGSQYEKSQQVSSMDTSGLAMDQFMNGGVASASFTSGASSANGDRYPASIPNLSCSNNSSFLLINGVGSSSLQQTPTCESSVAGVGVAAAVSPSTAAPGTNTGVKAKLFYIEDVDAPQPRKPEQTNEDDDGNQDKTNKNNPSATLLHLPISDTINNNSQTSMLCPMDQFNHHHDHDDHADDHNHLQLHHLQLHHHHHHDHNNIMSDCERASISASSGVCMAPPSDVAPSSSAATTRSRSSEGYISSSTPQCCQQHLLMLHQSATSGHLSNLALSATPTARQPLTLARSTGNVAIQSSSSNLRNKLCVHDNNNNNHDHDNVENQNQKQAKPKHNLSWTNPQNLAAWIDNEVNTLVNDLEVKSQLMMKQKLANKSSSKLKWLSSRCRRNSSGAHST